MPDDDATTDHVDDHGWSPLHAAAGQGDAARVTRLLATGADAGAAARDGRTAYQVAVAAGHLEAATVLRAAEDAAAADGPPDRSWRPYCRGYRLGDLRAFPDWRETWPAGAEPGADPDTVVYLHDDLTVTRLAWPGEDVLFDRVSTAWEGFCRDTLGFAVPDDFDLLAPPLHAGGSSTG